MVEAEPDMVVEDISSGFCGAVVVIERGSVTLEDRQGRRRVFPYAEGAFLLDGRRITLARPRPTSPIRSARTASGSIAAPNVRARVAVASRLFVEGLHDAQLVERLWGDDLRDAGVVVEILDGADNLNEVVAAFRPSSQSRMGVLLDHLVAGSKETRISGEIRSPHVLVRGHPFVDVWQAVKPKVLGLAAWPSVPRDLPWKETVASYLGHSEVAEAWRFILSRVNTYLDLEPALLAPVEELIDFVTAPHMEQGS
ncbi:MAG TPA: DUF3097 family protein [Mycobacteriales bacterium]|nr:DUF3097 family protein [Mycobacteriales bacterium]